VAARVRFVRQKAMALFRPDKLTVSGVGDYPQKIPAASASTSSSSAWKSFEGSV
jgi:hypothetical protein